MKTRKTHASDLNLIQMMHEAGNHTLCYFPTCKTRDASTGRVGYHDGGHAGWCVKAGTNDG